MNGYVISSRTLVACDCLFMLELKLHHVSKGGPGWVTSWCKQRRKLIVPASKRETNGRNEFCRKMKCIYQIYDFPLFCTFHVNKTNSWWYFFQASVGTIRTTMGYLQYETSLVESAEFKIGLPVALVLVPLLCLIIFIAYRSVKFLHNKIRVFQQRKHLERKFSYKPLVLQYDEPVKWGCR